MRRKRRIGPAENLSDEGAVNLTPLIDVVFVVLIMFIIVAPLLDSDKVQLAVSSSSKNKEAAHLQESSPLKIHVLADNKILFQSQPVTLAQLVEFLKAAKNVHPHQIPQLFQDEKAQFGTYQSVKNAVEDSGFEELDVVLKPG